MLMVSFSATCWTVCVSFLNVLRVDPLYYLKNSILHCIHVACSFKSGHLAVHCDFQGVAMLLLRYSD